jgi:hypothetical protein
VELSHAFLDRIDDLQADMTFERQRLSNRNFVSVSERSALERANSKRLTDLSIVIMTDLKIRFRK